MKLYCISDDVDTAVGLKLTGIKSVIFSAYEDIILLVCGIYAVTLFVHEIKHCTKK